MYCLVTLGDWLPPRSSATKKAKRCSRSKLAKAIEVLHLGFKQLRNAPSEHRNPGDVIERAIKALSMCPNLVTRSNNLMTAEDSIRMVNIFVFPSRYFLNRLSKNEPTSARYLSPQFCRIDTRLLLMVLKSMASFNATALNWTPIDSR